MTVWLMGAGSGPSVPVGNTLQGRPDQRPADSGPAAARLPAPVPAYEVTKMPIPEGVCAGKSTEAARQAGLEGTVVLDLTVAADGTTHDIAVVSGLGSGLTEAAMAALRSCRFAPGERAGAPVPVRVRSFKVRFFLNRED